MNLPRPQDFLLNTVSGTRVVVRYRLDNGFTDALGYLLSVADGACTIRTRQSDVEIPLALVVAAKAVPPPPPRRGPRTTRE
ncbi:putative acetyltransferase [Arthrobacter sp. S2(2024)]|uniref:putative acetyltransferase n=1 Tax=Arthrobacter sp. S2(2024) TaxID=3111911 RepID=UPI002FCB1ABD